MDHRGRTKAEKARLVVTSKKVPLHRSSFCVCLGPDGLGEEPPPHFPPQPVGLRCHSEQVPVLLQEMFPVADGLVREHVSWLRCSEKSLGVHGIHAQAPCLNHPAACRKPTGKVPTLRLMSASKCFSRRTQATSDQPGLLATVRVHTSSTCTTWR